MVPRERIELSHLAIHDFESCASTNSATAASFKRDKSTNLPAGSQVPPFRHTSDFTLKSIYCLEKIGPRAFAPGPLLTTEQRKLQTIHKFLLPVVLYLYYIFPTKSRPGFKVSSPGSQLAGQTCPPCSRTNFAARSFRKSSFALLPISL